MYYNFSYQSLLKRSRGRFGSSVYCQINSARDEFEAMLSFLESSFKGTGLENSYFVAGGSPRFLIASRHKKTIELEYKIHDFDVFFLNNLQGNLQEEIEKVVQNICLSDKPKCNLHFGFLLEKNGNLWHVSFRCPEGKLVTLRKGEQKIQLVTEFANSDVEECLSRFDLNTSRIAVYKDVVTVSENCISDNLFGRVTIGNLLHPMSTFKRLMKYKSYGFSIPSKTISDYVHRIHEAGLQGREISGRFYID